MGQVVQLSPLTEEQAWRAYCDLVHASADDPKLLTDLAHQQQTARAWKRWRDLYLGKSA